MTKTSIIIIHSLPDKKIKSLGNKALINIGTENVIDYQIGFCNKLAKNNEIIVIGAFESKKLQKYLNKKYPKVKYISHRLTEFTNIGLGLQYGVEYAMGDNLIIMNGNILIEQAAVSKIKQHIKQKHNFLITTRQSKSNVGFINHEDGTIANCFFDLPKPLYDLFYIDSIYRNTFSDMIHNRDFEKHYLFEIINESINTNITFRSVEIDSRNIHLIDNNETINKFIRKRKRYV
mgnify:CR=1 FL=1